jgi:hypothetical protein
LPSDSRDSSISASYSYSEVTLAAKRSLLTFFEKEFPLQSGYFDTFVGD